MKKISKQVVIVDSKSHGNSFGDRTFEVTAEYRENGAAIDTKTFKDTAFEGEHSDVKTLMTKDINAWAKTKGTSFTGWV